MALERTVAAARGVTSHEQKITYTSTDVDLEAFHREFDSALERVRGAAGGDHPNWIGGEAVVPAGAHWSM